MIEELMELVAASLARNGMACPSADLSGMSLCGQPDRAATTTSSSLPDHNFRQRPYSESTP